MKDYLNIGPTPANEDCAQFRTAGYKEAALRECNRFIQQLRKQFGIEPEGASLKVQSFPYDGSNFGDIDYYYEVVCEFDENIPESVEYAYHCESDAWNDWEDIQE